MSTWTPILLFELQQEIDRGIEFLSPKQISLWKKISIQPEKWVESEYGAEGGGFWVVAICDNEVIWYNDIEGGFNISIFSDYWKIEEYGAE